MNVQKIGALAVVTVLLVTCIGAFATGYDTEVEVDSSDSDSTSSTTSTNGSVHHTEYLIGGIALIFVALALILAIFRSRD